jgi:hypothetical protein
MATKPQLEDLERALADRATPDDVERALDQAGGVEELERALGQAGGVGELERALDQAGDIDELKRALDAGDRRREDLADELAGASVTGAELDDSLGDSLDPKDVDHVIEARGCFQHLKALRAGQPNAGCPDCRIKLRFLQRAERRRVAANRTTP